MKELSVEEKAKRYESALERARKLQETCDSTAVVGWCEYIFPELKESEDKQHRKWILEYLYDGLRNSNEQFKGQFKAAIAWLEKQGESYTKRDVDNAYIEGMAFAKDELEKQGDSPIKWNKNTKDCKPQKNHSVLMKTTHGIAEGEWQGEQWLQYRWSGIIKDSDVIAWMELDKQSEQIPANSAKTCKNEQKPAWSEEDERILDALVTSLNNEHFTGRLETLKGIGVSLVIDWLKFLKSRIERQ